MQRRKFIGKAALAAMASTIGTDVVFGINLPKGYVPLALQEPDPFELFEKDRDMVLLNDKPWNMEAKAHLLNDKVTPNKFMFIRNNGKIPQDIDVDNWTLTINGESTKKTKRIAFYF